MYSINIGKLKMLIERNYDVVGYAKRYLDIDYEGYAHCPLCRSRKKDLRIFRDTNHFDCQNCGTNGRLISLIQIITNRSIVQVLIDIVNKEKIRISGICRDDDYKRMDPDDENVFSF